MKKTAKLISVILAVVMMCSMLPFFGSANIIKADNLETLIQNDSLAGVVDNLVKDVVAGKENYTGTVLRFCFTFIKEDSLKAAIGGTDITEATDEQLAKILLDWLDSQLPTWTADLQSGSSWGTIQDVVGIFGVDLKLNSCDEIAQLVVDVCNATVLNIAGDLGKLDGTALTKTKKTLFKDAVAYKRADVGDLKFVYNLLDWVEANSILIEKFVKGGIGSNGLSIGTLLNNVSAIKDALADINNMVKNVPDFAKSYIYLLIDGYADAGEIDGDAKGDWGKSAYKSYTADELLAAALIKVIKGDDEVVSQADCAAAAKLSLYELLVKYGPDLYNRLAIDALNGPVKDAINGIIRDYDVPASLFNVNYEFNADSFKDVFANLAETGIIGAFNDIVVKAAEIMLSKETYDALALVKGGNENLNENLTKVLKVVLPLFNGDKIEAKLGFKFDEFTAESVQNMTLETMATAVLKIFFQGWFKYADNSEEAQMVADAKNLDQLGAVAAYLACSNEWIPIEYDCSAFKAQIKNVKDFTNEQCIDFIYDIGVRLGAKAIASVPACNFILPAGYESWTWQEIADEIVDWAINFVDGIPAVAKKAGLSTERGKLDGYGPFYKINVILNELVDFSFLSNVGNATFKLDSETLLDDAILGNLFNFDIAGVLSIFEKNGNKGNILKEKSVISAVLSIVDNLLTAIFVHVDGEEATAAEVITCGYKYTNVKYDSKNGHFIGEYTGEKVDRAARADETAETVLAGDVDNDGKLSSSDARLALRASVGLGGDEDVNGNALDFSDASSREYRAADYNGDGAIKSDDARSILRVSVGLEP